MLTRLKQHYGLAALTAGALLVMTAAAPVDRAWTLALDNIRWPWVEAFMSRSLFEGEGFGANDPVLVMLLAVIGVYYLACRKPDVNRWSQWRPQAGFILVSALVTGVYFVHSLKWIVGRARPDLVIKKGLSFSHWFSMGPHFVTDGVYYGSFPSGHTSQMFIMMTMAFVLAGDPLLSRSVRICGWIWGAMAMAASIAMGLVRCMTLSHWLTDILGSILMGWIIMHLIYHHLLRIPDQRRFMARKGVPPKLPEAWEIIICLHWLVGVIGLTMVALGIRALLLQKSVWLGLLVPAGALPLWYAWRKSAALLHQVWRACECGPQPATGVGEPQANKSLEA